MAQQILQGLQTHSRIELGFGKRVTQGLRGGLKPEFGVFAQCFHNSLNLAGSDAITTIFLVFLTAGNKRVNCLLAKALTAIEL